VGAAHGLKIMSQLPLRLMQTALSASLGVWLVREAIRALKTGQARGRYLSFERRENPALFWLIVTLQIGFSAVCLLVLLRAWIFGP
jgi:hypothetical protein